MSFHRFKKLSLVPYVLVDEVNSGRLLQYIVVSPAELLTEQHRLRLSGAEVIDPSSWELNQQSN